MEKLKPLRLWPGLLLVVLQWFTRFVLPALTPKALSIGVFGGVLIGLLVLVWWAFFSRATRMERWGGLALIVIALLVNRFLLHESIATAGMGVLYFVYAIPVFCLALVIWAVLAKMIPGFRRSLSLVLTILISIGFWSLLRTGGFDANLNQDFSWRWSASPEDQLLARGNDATIELATGVLPDKAAWPGFRGVNRDGKVYGVTIATDWYVQPPVELWRRPVGPGWSSFAVMGDLCYTQEQRGEQEMVTCYQVSTGNPVWRHADDARFWEANAGAGPRATPTLHKGRVYALGATGILNVLDALNGSLIWSGNAAIDSGTKIPIWGIAASPLIVDSLVIVAAAGSILSYDLATGEKRWCHSVGGDCYSSPHLVTIDSVQQVLLQNQSGVISVSPADGTLLWEYAWKGTPIVQPAQTPNGDVLVSVDETGGVRRISAMHSADGWQTRENWRSDRLRPYFNDSVIHNGYVYGFYNTSLACMDLNTGARLWRGGRYGRGQILLLADQDVLIVLSEKGDLALVSAVPDGHTELARAPAIQGKTWNHPVLAGNVLLVRNGAEMAAFRLASAE